MLKKLFKPKKLQPSRTASNERLYAIGDIHGRLDLLERLYEIIVQDARTDPAPETTIIFLGDYVDRGPDSAGVINFLLNRTSKQYRHVFLKGNHEDAFCRAFESTEIWPTWKEFGGLDTVASYMVHGLSVFDNTLPPALRAAVPEEHRTFLNGLNLMHRSGDYVFVHAGIRPRVPVERQTPEDLMWIRRPFLDADGFGGLCIVHGHSQVEKKENLPHRIAVDTGAYHSGCLTCVVLEGEDRRFLST